MNGPKHYAEAERLVGVHAEMAAKIRESANRPISIDEVTLAGSAAGQALQLAQVHATLALAAATARAWAEGWTA